MPSYRLTLSYDGTAFAGSQIQPGQRTVQGELAAALRRLGGASAATTFAGRTDRGVHAFGQIVAVDFPEWRSTAGELERALAARLPADIAARGVAECSPAFHPRFDAVWREYRYWIAPGVVSPFLGRYAWLLRDGGDPARMNEAAGLLLGTHDFASFAGGGEGVPWSERAARPRGTTRTLLRCAVREMTLAPGPGRDVGGSALELCVTADGFLPRMVRNIADALVEVGQGRREPDWVGEILAVRDRRQGADVAPAHGLTLWRVGYPGDALVDA
ncbi:MAG: tRNA pseudouridine(38-40) synthase TruA [Thermomicrobiales bacterium]|nr:tRNA pseudouridine(38-40) synthase TruA [Thermomicrobiales bacterium]